MVAVAAGTVLFALVLAIGRDPLPALASPQPPTLRTPASPEHLEPVPETAAPSKFVDFDISPETRVTVPIRVLLPAGQQLPPGSGVATFDTETAADFRWHPIEDIAGAANEVTVPAECVRGRTQTITLAADRDQARHGYFARRDVRCEPGADGTMPIVELSGRVTTVTFLLPVDCERIGPLRLGRVDDPQWVAMGHDRIGLTIAKDSPLSLQLGDGDYELTDSLTGQHAQRFTVPATASVTVDAKLSRARADRR
ncbi:MAG: hypothetical protein R3F29_12550 [Planctomycetota bacterium]